MGKSERKLYRRRANKLSKSTIKYQDQNFELNDKSSSSNCGSCSRIKDFCNEEVLERPLIAQDSTNYDNSFQDISCASSFVTDLDCSVGDEDPQFNNSDSDCEPLWRLKLVTSVVSLTSFCEKLVQIQTFHKASTALMDSVVELCQTIVPSINVVPKNFNAARSIIKSKSKYWSEATIAEYYCTHCKEKRGSNIFLNH